MRRLLNADPITVETAGVEYAPPQLTQAFVPPLAVPSSFDMEGVVDGWVALVVERSNPAVEATLGWSDSGWAVDEFEWDDTPAIVCDGPGRFSIPVLDLKGRFLAVKLEGGPGNGLDTVVQVSAGGTC